MTAKPSLILASTSASRRSLMENAGLHFSCHAPQVDEREIGNPLEEAGVDAPAIALALAKAKAVDVSLRHKDALVIGADQTMALGKEMFHKPRDLGDAKQHLLRLVGQTHSLHSAVSIARNGDVIWHHVATAHLSMRPMSDLAIDRYLAKAGSDILWSVGAYQLEGLGVTLFEKIDGDFFTILGLPMLPVLEKLRQLGAADE